LARDISADVPAKVFRRVLREILPDPPEIGVGIVSRSRPIALPGFTDLSIPFASLDVIAFPGARYASRTTGDREEANIWAIGNL